MQRLLARHMNALSLAESLALAFLDTLRDVEQGRRPHSQTARRDHLARTLERVEAWEHDAERLWTALGVERRKSAPAGFDTTKDRRRLPKLPD